MFETGVALGQAIAQHQAGNLDQAAVIYRRILDVAPSHADALHLLGLVASSQGRHREAVSLIGQAVNADPAQPVYLANLGLALGRNGRHEEAIEVLRRSLTLRPGDAGTQVKLGRALLDAGRPSEAIDPLGAALNGDYEDDADTWNALGRALAEADRQADAETCFRRALIADPRAAEARHNLGQIHFARGEWREAAEQLRHAVALAPGEALPRQQFFDSLMAEGAACGGRLEWREAAAAFAEAAQVRPESAEAHFNHALARSALGDLDRARAGYTEAIRLDPSHVRAHNNLSNLLTAAGQTEEAAGHLRAAIALDPGYWEAHYNLGIALQDIDRAEEALDCYRQVLRLRPRDADTRNNIGGVLLSRGRLEEAIAMYDEALEIQPDHPDAVWNKGLAQLALGDFANGWRGYEARQRQKRFPARSFPMPRWTGEDLAGKRLLVWAEQGLGDALQCLRYLPMLSARGAAVTVECQDRLQPLVRWAETTATICKRGEAGTAFDFHIPMMSLPGAFATGLDSIPPPGPEIRLPGDLIDFWREVIGQANGRQRIGVCWEGNRNNYDGRRRSMPAATIARLGAVGGARWFSLQADVPAPDGFEKLEHAGTDLADAAAIVTSLDLVITVDTMIAHLAGLLGRPVWTLVPFAADWRWMRGRDDSPWYPTMRLWRQSAPGDWDGVIDRVAAELQRS